MPTPFPGMDPYLERPGLWTNVHSRLIVAIGDELVPLVRPRYYVALEERMVRLGPDDVMLIFRPDVAVAEATPTRTVAPLERQQAGGVITVELPMLEDLREIYLEIREVSLDPEDAAWADALLRQAGLR